MKLTTLVNYSIIIIILKEALIFFFNPDNVCIESLSIDITRPILDSGARSIGLLAERIEE